MDDLTTLRALGGELEHEPSAAALDGQRRRLLGALDGSLDGGRRGRRWPRRPGARGAVTLALAAAATAAVLVVPNLLLRGHEVPSPVGARPVKANEAINVLVAGTDGQAGARRSRGEDVGDPRANAARADTLLLVHLSADRERVSVISIPRDSMVLVPPCSSPAGKTVPARIEMINASFAEGGMACLWKRVETLTGVRVDHAVEVDFSGFKGMVDAIGGIEVTLPSPVEDRQAKVRLPKGRQVLNGDQALGYVRVRYSLGDGSDLERIGRQQRFMASLARKAAGLTSDPVRLAAFLGEAAKSVKADRGLDLATLRAIAESLDGTAPGSVEFLTVPVRPSAVDPMRLDWDRAAASRLFAKVRDDTL
ncbi:LCP family protein [Streptosporangium sp. NPDC020145]|uniref:LCP family protein n=1 Tax=Streptosporangium sp. NPDC020145 TaxID=3154694 RepID=UPI00344983E5